MSTPQERLTAVMKERDEALELAARQTRRLILAEQQRDEARAEAERLRATNALQKEALSSLLPPFWKEAKP